MPPKLDETNDMFELLRLNNDQLGVLLRLLGRFDPAAVYVFGSRAQGTSGPQSDLDVAFLSSQPCDVWEVYLASQELSSLLGLEVELLDLRRASTVMRKEVIRTGRCIARVRPNEAAEFEMYTLSNYARLNEERAPVLRAIAEEHNNHA
ncbi:MAG: type VII toxin-antitoxin system MntA family adenylyltransferase antitoxin [Verrucomicrobiia bacterium]